MTSETNQRDKSRIYTYDVAGNLTRTVDRNGRVVQYVYDALDIPSGNIGGIISGGHLGNCFN